MKRFTAVALLSASIMVAGGAFAFRMFPHDSLADTTDALTIGGPFTLTDQNGNRFSTSQLAGALFLVGFGYTSCPDVCPTMLQTMTELMGLLTEQERAQFRPIFISVDSQRDTPDVLKNYLSHFHPDIIGLTGTKDEIKSVAAAYKAYYKLHEPDGNGSYMVDHVGTLYLMGRQGRFTMSFSHATSPASMADVVKKALGR